MTLDEAIKFFRDTRDTDWEITYARAPVTLLLDAYDQRGRDACAVIKRMARLLLPATMHLAQVELVAETDDEKPKDDDILFHFMGSGASDTVTVGEYRAAIAEASAFMRANEEEETDDRSDQ